MTYTSKGSPVESVNREEWLTQAGIELGKLFPQQVPEFRVSVGFPGGGGRKKNVIGQCWGPEYFEDQKSQVFISPTISDPVTVLSALLHEMVHVVDRCESQHKGNFIAIASEVGLVPPWTATIPSDDCKIRLQTIADKLGTYPHVSLVPIAKEKTKQSTRMRKCTCENTGYLVRMTKKWLDLYGTPMCPCCQIEMTLEQDTEGNK